MNYGRYAYDFLRLAYFVFYLHFLHKPKNSKLNLLYLVPFLSLKLNKYLSSFNDKKGTKYKRFNLEFFGLCKKCK